MPLSPGATALAESAIHEVEYAYLGWGLSDECPRDFCCPKFYLQARVALLWKKLHGEGWKVFLGEQKKPSADVSLLQVMHYKLYLFYAGWVYPSFQVWVTEVSCYRPEPMFKHFPSRSGFGLCASEAAFVNQNGGIGSCFQEFIISTVLE